MLSKLIHAEIIRKLQGFWWPQEKWKLIICLNSLDIVKNQFLRTNDLRYDPEWYYCNKSDKKFKSSSIKNYECCLSKFIHDHSWHTIKWMGIGKRNRFRFYFLCFQKNLHCSLFFHSKNRSYRSSNVSTNRYQTTWTRTFKSKMTCHITMGEFLSCIKFWIK